MQASRRELTVLGIETSCDETAAAVVHRPSDGLPEIRSNIILSQTDDHAAFGGVVPEIAARAHVGALDDVIMAALNKAGLTLNALDAIAVTSGPGLAGGLAVGLMTAKGLAAASGLPLIAVNHLEGHALTPRITANLYFPYLLLLVSGGHTQIILVRGPGHYERWGSTIDDALGEAFDKTAKLLGLPYPGGPSVENAAANGDPERFRFPRPLKNDQSLNFSFSGLKTAVRNTANAIAPLTERDVSDICAGFQQAIAEVLASKVSLAMERYRDEYRAAKNPVLVIAGGVAANASVRSILQKSTREQGFAFHAPDLRLCGDNAAMIAFAAIERIQAGLEDGADAFAAGPRTRWPLDEDASPAYGHGKRGAKA